MSDTIGARLRQARELRKLTLLQVSETTKLRIHYLQALESDDYSAIPSAAQARGFLRIYAEFLGLGLTDLMPAFQPGPATAEAAAPVEVKAAKPNLFAGLRGRLQRRSAKETEAASGSAGLMPQHPEQALAQPASTDAQTTRPIQAVPEDVKKNASLGQAEEPVSDVMGEPETASSADLVPPIAPLPPADALAASAPSSGSPWLAWPLRCVAVSRGRQPPYLARASRRVSRSLLRTSRIHSSPFRPL
jgi:cytoskeletal protein RodZ